MSSELSYALGMQQGKADGSVLKGFEGIRALACFGRGPALLGNGDALQGELEPITTIFGAVDDLLDVQEHFRIIQLLTKLLEEGMDLGKDEIHFATDGRE